MLYIKQIPKLVKDVSQQSGFLFLMKELKLINEFLKQMLNMFR